MSCLKACKLPRCPASHLRGLTRKKTVRHADSTGARRKEPPNLASHPCAPHPAILHVFLLESVRNSLAGVLPGHTALGALWALQVLSSENRPSHSKLPGGEVARICIKGTWDDQVFFLNQFDISSVWCLRDLPIATSVNMEAASRGHFRLAGREYPKVTWWREPEMRKVYFILMFVVLTSVSVFVYVISKADSSQMQGYKRVRFEHGEWPSSVGPVQLMYVHLEIRRNLYIRLESQMSLFVFSH